MGSFLGLRTMHTTHEPGARSAGLRPGGLRRRLVIAPDQRSALRFMGRLMFLVRSVRLAAP